MTREEHIAYVKNLTALADASGKEMSTGTLRALGVVAKSSKGRPDAFLRMAASYKKKIIGGIVSQALTARKRAIGLGRELGKTK